MFRAPILAGMSEDDYLCHRCGAPYGEGTDCAECKAVRRKDVFVRVVIGAMFIVPMLMLLASLFWGMLGGTTDQAVPD